MMKSDGVGGLPDLTLDMVEAKEKELAERRKAILRLQSAIPSGFGPEPNFPPEFCCIKPQVYHNIKEQVPVEFQRFMYTLCGLYISTAVLIIYNIICALVALFFGGSALHLGLSFIYLIGIPGAFTLWYYNVYCAVTRGSQSRRLLSYLGLFSAFLFDVWMALGIPGLGGCGWLITVGMMGNIMLFIMFLISSICWSLHGALLLATSLGYWRKSLGSVRSVYETPAL